MPRAKTLNQLTKQARADGVQLIFVQSQYNKRFSILLNSEIDDFYSSPLLTDVFQADHHNSARQHQITTFDFLEKRALYFLYPAHM